MSRLFALLVRCLFQVFGRWDAPPWARWLGRRGQATSALAWRHKLASLVMIAVVAGGATGGVLGWRWWKARPRPAEFKPHISSPALTPIGEKATPRSVTIEFNGSVAPLKAVGHPVKSGIEVRPKVEGTWKWLSDRELEMRPEGDWPVGQTFEVKLAKKGLVAEHIRLSTYDLEFKTAPFVVDLRSSEFYQDPVDANLKKVVAEVSFSHPVDAPTFEKNVKLHFEPSNREEKAYDLAAHITYDRWKARAFVHSAPFVLSQKDATVHITIAPGTTAARGGPAFARELKDEVKVPGLYNFFRVSDTRIEIVDNPRLEPEQLLLLQLSAAATEKDMGKALEVWLLPTRNPKLKTQHGVYRWGNPEEIDATILGKGSKLALQAVPTEKEYVPAHSFHFKADPDRYIYIRLKKGVPAFGGYLLAEDYQAIQRVPEYARQLKLLHSGSLLALSGKRKVALFARDVPGIRLEIARVLPDQIHHFLAFASGTFSQGSLSYPMNPEHLSEFYVETRAIEAPPGKPVYETLDLGQYLDGPATERRGLFLVKAESWNPANKDTMGERDTRLVLVTDLGILSKESADGTQDVFVQSILTGRPVAGAKVQVLGLNGQPVLGANTDHDGHARLPSLRELKREKAPVAFEVSFGRDTSYLPLGKSDRMLNLSRFDVGGVSENQHSEGLTAHVFSDRGVYRPGDEIHLGMLVRGRDLNQDVSGLPLRLVVTDPRGREVKTEKFKLGATGFEEMHYRTQEASPTGEYTVELYTVKDNAADGRIGTTKVTVREFLPDRMVIRTSFNQESPEGWVAPKDLTGQVTLTNLFGTPAADRRVRSKLVLQPGMPVFAQLRGYHFFNPQRPIEPTEQNLADAQTDEQGRVTVALGLERFASATYRLTLVCEGFEPEGGRSVTAEATTVVSPRPWLVGFKADGDLRYIPKDSERTVDLIGVGPRGAKLAVDKLQAVLLERRFVSSLVRLENGTYRYQSLRKDVEVSRKPIDLPAAGRHHRLPTEQPGDFVLVVQTREGETVQEISFSVAGTGDLSRSMEKNAELQVSLRSGDVAVGGEVELQIKAPYTGSGFITIERDRVYAWKWFKSTENASVQRIRVPAELEGGGYVAVSFVRDAGSDEVFASPLSHAVVPFSISAGKRDLDVKVVTDDLVKPGTSFHMKVTADRPGRAVVYAVDEGILRVASYHTPDPLGHFLQKKALGVQTFQILDLILPEYSKLMEGAAPGGDEEDAAIGANLNPFRRRRDKPVVYWSGIVDVGPQAKTLVYEIPDSFNGTLRVMAVASAVGAMGAFDKKTIVRGDFVITPNVPTFAAPGDELEVSVGLANNVVGSGKNARPTLSLTTSKHLEILGPREMELPIAEMREGSTVFRIKALAELGSASLKFEARLGEKKSRLATDLSVRPASPYVTTLQAGYVKNGDHQVKIERRLFAEHRTLEASVAAVPLALARGLSSYLETFPHGCTEQIVSQVLPAVALGRRPDTGMDRQKAIASVAGLVEILRSRQNDEGGFGLWAANPKSAVLPSVWALHVLTEARQRGFTIPDEVLTQGMRYLETLAGGTPDDLPDARLRTHALYVLARNGVHVGRYAAALQHYLEANAPKDWRGDLAGAYLAATYAVTKQASLAAELANSIRLGVAHTADYEHYYDTLTHDAQALLLLSEHFPQRAAALGKESLDGMVQAIAGGSYNTFSSALSILALERFAKAASEPGASTRTVFEITPAGRKPLSLSSGLMPTGAFTPEATALVIDSRGDFGSYWSTTQAGFDREPDRKPFHQKIEIVREFLSEDDKVIGETELGDEIQVRLRLRAPDGFVSNVAIVDLLPAGFEVVIQPPEKPEKEAKEDSAEGEESGGNEGSDESESSGEGNDEDQADNEGDNEGSDEAEEGPSTTPGLGIALPGSDLNLDYLDVREDRVVLYGQAGKDMRTFIYRIKATNAGTMVVPAIHAESMYDRTVHARGEVGTFKVVRPKH